MLCPCCTAAAWRLRVAVHQPPDYGFFYARFPVPDEPPRWAQPPPLPAGNAVVIPRAPHPDPVLDAALLTMLLPASLVPPDPIFEPTGPAGRLHLPWRQDPLTGLLVPDHTLQDLWWARSFPVCCNITPSELGLPFDAADLDAVAWAVLRRWPVSALVEVLAWLAFGIDILGSPGPLDRAITELLSLPGELQARLRGTVHHGSPLLDPRCVRWIIRELAVAKATGQNAGPEPWQPATLAQEAIARVLFPTTLGTGGARLRFEEVLRAVWLLHEAFELGDDTAAEADRAISMVAAITYGVHQSAGMLRFLDRGRRLLEVDDAHPAVAGFSPLSSALREVFTPCPPGRVRAELKELGSSALTARRQVEESQQTAAARLPWVKIPDGRSPTLEERCARILARITSTLSADELHEQLRRDMAEAAPSVPTVRRILAGHPAFAQVDEGQWQLGGPAGPPATLLIRAPRPDRKISQTGGDSLAAYDPRVCIGVPAPTAPRHHA